MRKGIAAALLLSLVGCTPPVLILITRQDESFQLPLMRRERVAVWPIPGALLDEAGQEGGLFSRSYLSTSQAAAKFHGSRERFLDAVARQFSNRLVPLCQQGSLSSDEIAAMLGASDATRPFLDPARTLGEANPENRFVAKGGYGPEAMAALPGLSGVAYAVLFHRMRTGRTIMSNSSNPGAHRVITHGELAITVVDLRSRRAVWEGKTLATVESIDEQGLKDVADELVGHFMDLVTPEEVAAREAKKQKEEDERRLRGF